MKRRDFFKERVFYTALADLVKDVASVEQGHGMIIPGGSTPKPLYQRLLHHKLQVPQDFRFILSDERYCKPSSPDSNQGAILPMLKIAGVESSHVIFPDMGLPQEVSAAKFEEDISFFLDNGGSIEAAVLGVGSDGHTAGIFDESGLTEGRRAVVTQRADGFTGITCTPELIMLSKRLIFILRGATKQDIVESMFAKPESTVAGRIGMAHPDSEVWFCLE